MSKDWGGFIFNLEVRFLHKTDIWLGSFRIIGLVSMGSLNGLKRGLGAFLLLFYEGFLCSTVTLTIGIDPRGLGLSFWVDLGMKI